MTSKTALCAVEDIEDGQARGFEVKDIEGGPLILVARQGDKLFGYINSCPHLGAPIDWAPDKFMDQTGKYLRCATHGALFVVDTGQCVWGPCEGDALRPVAVELRDGQVYLAA